MARKTVAENRNHQPRRRVVIGIVGSMLDGGGTAAAAVSPRRWGRWRPSVDLTRDDAAPVDRFELLHHPQDAALARQVQTDIAVVSPHTSVCLHALAVKDAWDFEAVYGALFDFCSTIAFQPDDEDYFVHITTGTHVVQICWFLLTESRRIPGRLLQTSPPQKSHGAPRDKDPDRRGVISVIDLDLDRYDRLRARFDVEHVAGVSSLKAGVATKSPAYNALIDELEQVASASTAPLLLLGPTGTGKTRLARRVYDLKRARRQVSGPFVEVNCATLRGDAAMSTLFGHKKGAFTGALSDREGLLRGAHNGVLFLDEVGELGLDEQAMLLRAIEEKRFLPMGADTEVTSSFQLLCGTHRDLNASVRDGRFRDDLLARIDIWSFALPALKDRLVDIEPNLAFELQRASTTRGLQVSFSTEAKVAFLKFATAADALWPGNFRELAASIERLATLAVHGRIQRDDVAAEAARRHAAWRARSADVHDDDAVGSDVDLAALVKRPLDAFDSVQLRAVVSVCRKSRSLAEAGRVLFAESRKARAQPNDSDRVRKYLASFGLSFDDVRAA